MTPLVATGCTTHFDKSYTFVVETGDDVKVTLDMKSGYDLAQDGGQFEVTNGDETIVTGMFTESAQFYSYKGSMDAGSFDGEVEESADDILAWTYSDADGEEHNRFVLVSDNTAVLMGSLADADAASTAYDALSFEVVTE